uniref:C6 domain-containing protein n=1 Tax=Acrobeloides nanus TaxID=290746 RepID=A0A914D1D4_9BILA
MSIFIGIIYKTKILYLILFIEYLEGLIPDVSLPLSCIYQECSLAKPCRFGGCFADTTTSTTSSTTTTPATTSTTTTTTTTTPTTTTTTTTTVCASCTAGQVTLVAGMPTPTAAAVTFDANGCANLVLTCTSIGNQIIMEVCINKKYS